MLQGKYEIVRRVGSGGMGEVYEARHLRLPGRFAIKVLRREVLPESPELGRFRQEAEIASSLRHPNIVQVVDFDQTSDGQPYIVMEFLDGRDLATELSLRGALTVPRVLAIVDQVASALAAAHGKGIVHRDLKPQNIFLVPVAGQDKEFVKVIDFGISKVKTAATITGEAHLMGTPQYMSPEQAQSRSDEIDGRTDQFALAAIVYELLTGKPAFAGDTAPATLYKVCNEEPPPISDTVPGLPPGLDAALRRALAKSKDARYLTVLELSEALADAAETGAGRARALGTRASAGGNAGAATISSPPMAIERSVTTVRRASRGWVVGLVFAGAVGAIVVQQVTRVKAGAGVVPLVQPSPMVTKGPPPVPSALRPPPPEQPPSDPELKPVVSEGHRVRRPGPKGAQAISSVGITRSGGSDDPPPQVSPPSPAPRKPGRFLTDLKDEPSAPPKSSTIFTEP